MGFNNAALVHAIGNNVDFNCVNASYVGKPRRRVSSDLCLPERLPTISILQREAERLVPQELNNQILKASVEETVDADSLPIREGGKAQPDKPARPPSYIYSFMRSIVIPRAGRTPVAGWSNVQPFEIMKAVENRDIMFLMEVRDNAFPLLLQSSGGETPLVHAIRIGNKDVAIILLGAFSRWINHLEDEDVQKPQTQTLLKAIRVGLKLAIDEDLTQSQNDLIASFMQTLVMSEGDKWVTAQASTVARALNSGVDGKPVRVAGEAVRKFTTKELGKAAMIASLEDYIANATADLLLIGVWSNVLLYVREQQIPSSYFARDDRVYKAFMERFDRRKAEIQRRCNRRLYWQLITLRDCLEGRSTTFRSKIELLARQLDDDQVSQLIRVES